MTNEQKHKIAIRLYNDTAKYQRAIINAAAKIGAKTMNKMLTLWRASQYVPISANITILYSIPEVIYQEFMKNKDELRDAMLLAHLAGIKRARLAASLSLSAAKKNIDKLYKSLKIPKIELERQREIYNELSRQILQSESTNIQNKIQKTLNTIRDEGLHLKDGQELLIETFKNCGIVPENTFKIETIFRTHTQLAYSAGRWQANMSPEINEILWGYEYATVGDDRVRPSHVILDGVRLPKSDQFWLKCFPPNGWNCRCQAIELFREEEVKPPPVDAMPDDGFDFNPGLTYRKMAA